METKNYQDHPTVRAFGLRTFVSKYDNQRCCISGTAVPVGEPIANIMPIIDQLQAFGLVKTKSFKYAAVANLPLAATPEEVEIIKDVADRMVAATDPEWPLDNIGCSRSTYGPVASWVASGYNSFGATRAARYLQNHLGTQIEKDSVEGQTILTVANRKWNGQGGNSTTANTSTPDIGSKPVEKPVAEKTPTTPTTKLGDRPVKVAAAKRQGEILIAANGEGLKLFLDPPWTTPAHAVIKDAIKAQGARWDPEPKCWRIGVSALLLHLDLLNGQPLTVTPDAYKLLQDAIGCQRSSDAVDSGDAAKQRIREALPSGQDLYPFQYAGVEFVDRAGGRALIADDMGCVDGEAEVLVNRAGKGMRIKLKDLFHRFNGGSTKNGRVWDSTIDTYIRSAHSNQLHRTKVLRVLDKGVCSVLRIETASGKVLRLTPDHEVCVKITSDGRHIYKEAQKLRVGKSVVINGKKQCPNCGTTKDLITYPYAKFVGYCRTCMYRQMKQQGRANDNVILHKGYEFITAGLKYHPYNNHTGIAKHRLVYEATMNGLTLEAWLQICFRNDFTDKHKFLVPSLEIHHKNGNISDNCPENLEALPTADHRRRHPSYANFGFTVTDKDKIVSIRHDGKAHVYDVVCKAPHHNFVANGIVVHNCGKTIEAIGYLALHPELRPAVLVVPAVVTSNWRREANTWRPTETVQVLKTGKDTINPAATILVVTYDLLKKHIDAIKALNPKAVVGDEVHLVKNYKTARAASFCGLAKHPSVKAMIGLSGTPIVNRPVEFFTFLNLLRPSDFGSWRRFTERYCDGHEENVARGKWVYVAKGATHTDELNQRLRSFMIRRTKEQVLTELPPKTRTITDVEMTPAERREYRSIEGENALATITAQRQFVGRVKVRAAIEWIEQYADTSTPLLVFAHHHDVLDALQEGCRTLGVRFGRIDGSVGQEQRGRLVDDFQAGKTDVMLLSTKAAGVGITLTRASNVLVVERQFTPGDEAQAEDRCHRIGQASSVTIRYLMVTDSIDEDMAELLESKRKVLDAVLNGRDAHQDFDILTALIARYNARCITT